MTWQKHGMALCDSVDYSLCLWNSLGKNTGVGCHSLLQGSNVDLLHCKKILYPIWATRKASTMTYAWSTILKHVFRLSALWPKMCTISGNSFCAWKKAKINPTQWNPPLIQIFLGFTDMAPNSTTMRADHPTGNWQKSKAHKSRCFPCDTGVLRLKVHQRAFLLVTKWENLFL